MFQAFLLVYFVRWKFRLKHPELRYAVLIIAGAALFLPLHLWWNMPVTEMLPDLFPMCYALATAEHPKHYILFWTLLHFVLFDDVIQLCSNLFLLLPGASWQQVTGKTPMRIFLLSAPIQVLFEKQ